MIPVDFYEVADHYGKALMSLQNAVFKHNEDINVFKYETIPAIQYCSGPYLKSMYTYYQEFINILDKKAKYLNVGSGCNMLELVAKHNNIDIRSADIEETKPIFDPLRRLLKTPLNFNAGLYGKELTINTREKFDYIMFVRYVPFEYDLDEELFESFLRSAKKYADKAIISIVQGSYNDISQYINLRSDIILQSHIVMNSTNYIIDLEKI